MEGEGPPFRRRVQRGKAAIGRFCFAKSPLLPPNLPQPPRTSPMSPPFRKWKFVSLFRMAGTWGKFFVALGGETFCRVRLSHPIGKQDAICRDAIHECRNPACRHSVGHKFQTLPTHKTSAKPHFATTLHLPNRQKTSPMSPPFNKSESNHRFQNGGDMGEVRGR